MARVRKLSEGQKVTYKKQQWTVCKGGRSDPMTQSYQYHLSRGAWHEMVRGNCITM